jgi:hypothetical protein
MHTEREVWFTLYPFGAEDSQELYFRIKNMISFWAIYAEDPGGNVTYWVKCPEEHFEKLFRTFHNPEFLAIWGILKSGVLEGGQQLSWPEKEKLNSERVPPPTLPTKKQRFLWVWNLLRRALGPGIIK